MDQVAIQGVTPGVAGFTYGGSYNSGSNSDVRVQGLGFDRYFKLEVLPNSPLVPVKSGFVQFDGASWNLVSDSSQGTTFYSVPNGGGVRIGGPSGTVISPVASGSEPTIVLPVGQNVSGTVTAGGQPVAGACVGLFDKASVLEQRWVREGTSCTNAQGQWTITGVGNGQYLARLWGQGTGVVDGFYRQGADAIEDTALATTITVSSSPVTGVAVVGTRGKTVSGTISRPAGNYEICVSAWEEGAIPGWRNWRGAGCTRTSSFTFTVPDGTYKFEYTDRSQSLRTIWSGNATTFEDASPVVVNSDRNLGTQTMSAGASISGVITLQGGPADVGRVCVSALEVTGSRNDWGKWVAGTCDIPANGVYSLGGLELNKSLKLRFESFNKTHRSVFYESGSGWTSNHYQATLVRTGSTGVNVELPAGNSVSGTVFLSDGSTQAQFACVSAMTSDWVWVAGTCTPDGVFVLSGLPSDPNMRIRVEPPRNSSDQRGGWLDYTNSTWALSASQVTVSVTSPITGVNVSLSAGVQISGKVTPASEPTCISAFDASSFFWLGRGCTTTKGDYIITGLPASTNVSLFVEPASDRYKRDWLRAGGSIVSSSTGNGLSNYNFSLVAADAGSIAGTLTMGGSPLSDAVVFVKVGGGGSSNPALQFTKSGQDGKYKLSGLADGNYDVYVEDSEVPGRFVPPSPLAVTVSGGAEDDRDFSLVAAP